MTAMAALVLLLAWADPSDAALAKDAVAVLAKHCARCHGGAAPRAGFNVLDRASLLKRVVAGKPEASELLHRVESGMMPPGTAPKPARAERALLREWIAAGAPAVPPPPPVFVTGDDHVLGELARDWGKLEDEARADARYLSLNHLLAAPDGPAKLAAARKELRRMLGAFAAEPKLDAIDKQQSVFRLSLASMGWDARPFVVPGKKKAKEKPSPLDLFDLVLLEYPYAVASFSRAFVECGPLLKRVRPIAYVRGDWLLGLMAQERFARELMRLQGKEEETPLPRPAPKAVWGAAVSLDQARAELGWKGAPARLSGVLREARLEALADGKDVPRLQWQSRFPAVARALGLGTPLLPLDGLTSPDLSSDPAFGVKAWTIRYELAVKDKKGKLLKPARPGERASRFKARKDPAAPALEGLALIVEPSADAVLELALRDHKAQTDSMLAPKPVPGGKAFPFDNKGQGWEVMPPASQDDWLVFAAKGDSRPALPPGVVHRPREAKGTVRDRFVHPFYKLAEDGAGFARPLGAVAKATVRCKTVLQE